MEKHFKAKLMKNCNNELVNVTDESKVPEDCYYKMKWKLYKNQTTLTQNRNSLQEIGEFGLANPSNNIYLPAHKHLSGIFNYSILSLQPGFGLMHSTEIVILVIVRWNDPESRQFLRNILQKYTGGLKIQLLFVFGYPNVASRFKIDEIWRESLINQDLIVPRKFFMF